MFTRRITATGFVAALLLLGTAVRAADVSQVSPERPFEGPSSGTVRALLRCSATKIKIGDDLKLELEFTVSGGAWLYNPQLESCILLPGQVNLYDADGKFVCDLAFELLGGSRGADQRYFHWLEQGQTFGCRKSVYVGDTHPLGNPRKIEPGKHYVQLVYGERLFAYPIDFAASNLKAREAWNALPNKPDVLRSNSIVIEITR